MRRLLVAAVAVAAGVAVTGTMALSSPPVVLAAPVPVTGVEAGVVPLAVPVTGTPDAAPDSAVSEPLSTTVVSTSVDTSSAPVPSATDTATMALSTLLTVPALGIAAPVIPVRTGRDGVLHPPADVATVGRWTGGAAPGDPAGTVVITGHLDSRTQGKGALYSLGRARPGDQVTLGDVAYRVAAIRSYDKQALPEDIWETGGQPRLVIVTCGGRFVGGHYEQNTVVYAVVMQG